MAVPIILIVEDNETEQYALAKLVHRFDYQVRVVASGEEALDALEGKRFAAILMDLTLPGIDGQECTKRIRELERVSGGRTPIVALTGRSQASDRHASLEAGMDDYLSKPFDPEALRKILLRWVYEPSQPNLKVLAPSNDESYT
jgi:CheY-like chemotaxis protein